MAEVTLSTLVDLDLVKMKWRETYVSEGLNRKVAPATPAGIYQGLRMIENVASPRQVEITSDADTGYHMAVFQSTTGFSLTYWDIIGSSIIFDLSDANLDNQETIIAMELDYQIGVDTTADWKAFPIADFDALPAARRDDLIILGTVNVPAAATNITSAMISFNRMTMPWRNLSRGVVSWSPLLRNGDFEQAEDGASNAWYWALATTPAGGTGITKVSTADSFRNTRALTLASLTAGSVAYAAVQNTGVPVTPGQLGMIRLQKKNLVVPTGSLVVSLHFFDATGASTTTLDIPIDTSGVDGSYEELVSVFEVPASRTMLGQILISGALNDAGAPNDLIHIDDFQVWLETSGERNDLQHLMSGDIEVMGMLSMREPTSPYSDPSFRQNYDSGLNQVSMDDLASSGTLKVDINGTIIPIAVETIDLTATGTSLIDIPSGPAWHDATANPSERVDQRLDSIINDLVADNGSDRIGVQASTGGIITAGGSIHDALNEVEADYQGHNHPIPHLLFSFSKIVTPAGTSDMRVSLAGSGDDFQMELSPLPRQRSVTGFTFFGEHSVVANATVTLFKQAWGSSTAASIGSLTTTSGIGNIFNSTSFTGVAVDSGANWFIRVTNNGAGIMYCHALELTVV